MSLGTGNVGTIAVDSNGESQSLSKIFKKQTDILSTFSYLFFHGFRMCIHPKHIHIYYNYIYIEMYIYIYIHNGALISCKGIIYIYVYM